MRIFAISGGRLMGNNEMLLRIALKAAKEVCGAEIEMVRIHDLEIKSCVGCETCMRQLTTGGDGKCVLRGDDMEWLKEQIGKADGLLVAAPVYDLIPTGKMVNLLNRSLGIGKTFQLACRSNPKVGAAISLGGSDWVNLTEPVIDLTLCNLSKSAVVTDRLIVGHNPAPGMVLADNRVMERAVLLGKRMGKALLKRAAGESFGFEGDEGICQACHCNLLEFRGGENVSCPYCDARGKLTVVEGKVRIEWNQESLEKNRFTVYGEERHRKEIGMGHKKAAENKELIRQRLEGLNDFGGTILYPERKD